MQTMKAMSVPKNPDLPNTNYS